MDEELLVHNICVHCLDMFGFLVIMMVVPVFVDLRFYIYILSVFTEKPYRKAVET